MGVGGKILRHDGKGNVTADMPGSTDTLRAVWGSGPTNIYTVGYSGRILRYQGKGASSWKKHSSRTTANLHGVWGPGPSNVYAVGGGGAILHRCGP